MERFKALPLGIQLATAALGATIPRYVLAFLKADGIEFVDWLKWGEGLLLLLSALATAITVTAGAAYVAHVAASAPRPLRQRVGLFVLWLPSLVFEIIILAPALLSTMRAQPLACVGSALVSSAPVASSCVLPAPLDAGWSGVGIAACAYSAALCVVAASLLAQPARTTTRSSARRAAQTAHATTQVFPCPHGCGVSFRNQQGVAAHSRRCPARAVPNGNGHHA